MGVYFSINLKEKNTTGTYVVSSQNSQGGVEPLRLQIANYCPLNFQLNANKVRPDILLKYTTAANRF